MQNQEHEKRQAMMKVIKAIANAPLIGTDFANADAQMVPHQFEQASKGVRIEFTISAHALGKFDNQELVDALTTLGVEWS